MGAEIIILRLLHISTAVFWAGGVFYLAFFIFPAIKALGPDGGKFMQQLSSTRNMPNLMSTAGLINVLTGFRMMQIDSRNFHAEWFKSNFGIAITLGAIAAFAALLIGIGFNRPRANKMAQISKAIVASGAPPTAIELQELGSIRNKLEKGVKIMAWHLLVAVVLMAIARYL